jgi:hypothetical protein
MSVIVAMPSPRRMVEIGPVEIRSAETGLDASRRIALDLNQFDSGDKF